MKRKIEFDESFANEIYDKKIKNKKYNKKFSKMFSKILKLLVVLLVAFSVIKIAHGIWWVNRIFNVELLDEMKYKYNEEFTIISKEIIKNDMGTYIISPKNNRKITFKACKKGRSMNDDYRGNVIKYYTEKYVKENNINNINFIEDKTKTEFENFYLLYYDFWFEIESYNEIEPTTKLVYDIFNFITKNVNSDFMFNMGGKIRKEDYSSEAQYTKQSNIENLIYEEQYNYINYMKEHKLPLLDVKEYEINKIWKPKELKIIINKSIVENTDKRSYMDNSIAIYNPKIKDYEIYLTNIINYISSVEQLEKESGVATCIKYKGKKYEIKGNYIENKELPFLCNCNIIEKVFNANITYDYNSRKIYIDIE